jgi:hypothetical protein
LVNSPYTSYRARKVTSTAGGKKKALIPNDTLGRS